jgi:hypothetical protein
VFPPNATDAEKIAFFTNVKAGEPFKADVKSFDYSLQLGIGVRNFPGTPAVPAAAPAAAVRAPEPPGFSPRDGNPQLEPDLDPAAARQQAAPGGPAPGGGQAPAGGQPFDWRIVTLVLAAVAVALILVFWMRSRQRESPGGPGRPAA